MVHFALSYKYKRTDRKSFTLIFVCQRSQRMGDNKNFFDGYEKARAEKTIVAYYDQNAGFYEKTLKELGYKDTTDYGANTLRQYLQKNIKEKSLDEFEVLDLGCGSGLTGVSLNQSGFKQVDGVDPAKGMLEVAAKRNVYRNVVEGIITETERLSFPDAQYDGVLCIGCFTRGHIVLRDGLQEILRLLKKGGIAVYTVSPTMDLIGSLQEHLEFFSQKKFEMLRVEKKFYYSSNGDRGYCNVYVVRKI